MEQKLPKFENQIKTTKEPIPFLIYLKMKGFGCSPDGTLNQNPTDLTYSHCYIDDNVTIHFYAEVCETTLTP